MNQITIGNYIAQKRREQNLTQEQLGEKLGVSNKTVSKWETGKCMPDYSIIQSLCDALNITLAGAVLIVLGIASSALSATIEGSNVKDFISGLLLGLSIVEMVEGLIIAVKDSAEK